MLSPEEFSVLASGGAQFIVRQELPQLPREVEEIGACERFKTCLSLEDKRKWDRWQLLTAEEMHRGE